MATKKQANRTPKTTRSAREIAPPTPDLAALRRDLAQLAADLSSIKAETAALESQLAHAWTTLSKGEELPAWEAGPLLRARRRVARALAAMHGGNLRDEDSRSLLVVLLAGAAAHIAHREVDASTSATLAASFVAFAIGRVEEHDRTLAAGLRSRRADIAAVVDAWASSLRGGRRLAPGAGHWQRLANVLGDVTGQRVAPGSLEKSWRRSHGQ